MARGISEVLAALILISVVIAVAAGVALVISGVVSRTAPTGSTLAVSSIVASGAGSGVVRATISMQNIGSSAVTLYTGWVALMYGTTTVWCGDPMGNFWITLNPGQTTTVTVQCSISVPAYATVQFAVTYQVVNGPSGRVMASAVVPP